jgi:hypothetical protein
MKTLIIFSIAFLFCITAKTQEYTPFDFEKGIWIDYQSGMDGSGNTTTQYFCNGDTLIEGVKFSKLYQYSITIPIIGPFDTLPTSYICSIRNNDKRQVILGDRNPNILYDFNLKIGDTIINGVYRTTFYPVVKRIDSVLICGNYHKRYITQYAIPSSNDSSALIEGVGMNQCLFGVVNIFGIGESNNSGCYTEIENNSCSKCNLILNVKNRRALTENIKIYPNPSNSIVLINSPILIKSLNILDLYGQVVYSLNHINTLNYKIDTRFFKTGYYILNIEILDNTFIKKSFIKY